MKANEFQEVMDWLGKQDTLNNLPMDEQLCIHMAMLKMCESIKPLYEKHNPIKFTLDLNKR